MPRHQDNVDIILTSNTRNDSPASASGIVSANFALEEVDGDASWSEETDWNRLVRVFQVLENGRQLLVLARLNSWRDHARLKETTTDFGPNANLAFEPDKLSVFGWQTSVGHDFSLTLAAQRDGTSLEVHCVDPNPDGDKWTFQFLDDAGEPIASYTVDFTSMAAEPKLTAFVVEYTR